MVFGLAHDASAATVFDSLPFPAFIVDDDIQILAANPAGRKLVGSEPDLVLRTKGGEALRCINSTDGCGRSTVCPDCMIRNNVRYVFTTRQPVRTRATLEAQRDGHLETMHALVTASPVMHEGRPAVLLFLEDLALLFAMADVLPICVGCRKVRNDDLWLQIESYLDTHLNLKLSHGICPECASRLYPE
jgi:hypothetical protein